MPTLPADYYNRFDPAKRFEDVLVRAQRRSQSAEINEIQSLFADRVRRIADAVFRDGSVIRGTPPTINTSTGSISCPASAIYLRGAVREVPARVFNIVTSGLVRIGVFLLEEVITEVEDATLRNPAVQTRGYDEPGAARLRITPGWGREGEALQGVFYPVWTVIDGALLNQADTTDNTFIEALARYDRESNGNYIVSGLTVQALGLTNGNNTFTVREGVGNVLGYKIDKPSSTRLLYAEDPDLESVDSEPDTFTGTTGGTATITLNRIPVSSIVEVVITKEKTVTITRGGTAGGQDTLPDVSVLNIQSIVQGGTTFHASTYFLNGDKVDWSPSGAEPSPGSTYTITYQYLGNVTPSNVNLQAGTFNVTGAVNGTLVLTDYQWKLPRFDRICLDRDGNLTRYRGLSSRYTPLPPVIPGNLLLLATVEHRWGQTPIVTNDGFSAIPFDQLERMRSLIVDLYDLVALERLRNDISSREPSSKRGVFVDPFIDDDLRDQGITQTAAIVDGTLQLPIVPAVYRALTNAAQDWLLPYTEEVILEQTRVTGSSPINPYQAFDPIPAAVTLTPSVDRWTAIDTIWTSPVTQAFAVRLGNARQFAMVATASARTELLSESERPAEFLRQITIAFAIDGFDPGETLQLVEFDGINVTPA